MKHFVILILLVIVIAAPAEDLYFTQNGAGAADGSSVGNAWSLAQANTAGNWGAGPGKVSSGDTLHVSGTITNTLNPQASGAAGDPITILFDSGAKFSKPAWGNVPPTADDYSKDPIAVTSFYISNLIIDGGGNGVIECTDNGTGKTFTNNCTGIYLLCGAGVEIKNLTITNLYFRTYGTLTDLSSATAIILTGAMTNCSIHNCTSQVIGNGFTMNPSSAGGVGISTNCQMYSNTVSDCSWGLAVGQQVNSSNYNFKIWNNRINVSSNYSGNPDAHQDGIICYITQNSEKSYNLQIFGNYIGPLTSVGNTTAAIFINDTPGTNNFVNPMVYNNVSVLVAPFNWANGHISVGSHTALIANNTIISWLVPEAPGYGAGFGITLYAGTNTQIYNNLTYDIQIPVYRPYGTPVVSDYNNWNLANDTSHGFGVPFSSGTAGWNTWTNSGAGYGFDAHSSTNRASLGGNYVPLITDTVARGMGTNLSAYFTTDFNGATRPAGAWTIGAFEAAGQSPVSRITIGTIRSGGIR